MKLNFNKNSFTLIALARIVDVSFIALEIVKLVGRPFTVLKRGLPFYFQSVELILTILEYFDIK